MTFWVSPEVITGYPQLVDFQSVMTATGEYYRDLPTRQTLKITGGPHSKALFLKRHLGVGWREIFKNLLQGRLPVIGAENELKAIRRLEQIGVDTLTCVGFGKMGSNPARQQSFIVTEDLTGSLSLEEFTAGWENEKPSAERVKLKRLVIQRLAMIARQLHESGVNHRDFYICHFHLWRQQWLAVAEKPVIAEEMTSPRLVLIDLHRVQIRRRLPLRWRLKDLAGLYFSAMDAGLTQRDCLRFIAEYGRVTTPPEAQPLGLKILLQQDGKFWSKVDRQARKLYYKAHRRYPPVAWPQRWC